MTASAPRTTQQQAEQRGTQEVRAGLRERSGGRRAGGRSRAGLGGWLGGTRAHGRSHRSAASRRSTTALVVGVAAHGRAVVPSVPGSGQLTLSSDWPVRPRVAWGVARRSSSLATVVDRFSRENAIPPRRAAGEEHAVLEARRGSPGLPPARCPGRRPRRPVQRLRWCWRSPHRRLLLTLPSARWMAARWSSASPAAVRATRGEQCLRGEGGGVGVAAAASASPIVPRKPPSAHCWASRTWIEAR